MMVSQSLARRVVAALVDATFTQCYVCDLESKATLKSPLGREQLKVGVKPR
jgi:hypothetical protein